MDVEEGVKNASCAFRALLDRLEHQHVHELRFLQSENLSLHSENTRLRTDWQLAADSFALAAPSRFMFLSPNCEASEQLPVPPAEPQAPEPCQGSSGGLAYQAPTSADGEQETSESEPAAEDAGSSDAEREQPALLDDCVIPQSTEATLTTPTSASPEESRSKSVFESDPYELMLGGFVLLNVVSMAVEFEYAGYITGHSLRYPGMDLPPHKVWPSADTVFYSLNLLFTVGFTIDIALRLAFLRWRFCGMIMNWIDFTVVLLGVVEIVLGSALPLNAVFLRLLRLAKVARALRVIKITKVLESLHLLLKSITSSVEVLFWSLCLLGVIQCIAGMIISQIVKGFLDKADIDAEKGREVFRYYGTFTKTLLTMFEVLFANWAPPCRILVDHVSDLFIWVFIFYRCLVGFAILNVVNAVFIQQTMKVAQADHEFMMTQKRKAAESYSKKLRALFHRLDSSGDGFLSWQEFSVMLEDKHLKTWMSTLEIEVHDLTNLFHMMDDGDGEISVDEFMDGAVRLRGHARSVDLAHVLTTARRVDAKVEAVLQSMATLTGQDARSMKRMASKGLAPFQIIT
eukprot:TRINITY_DN76271_c0_g1_i1.p1 TRINITY_DN76271_c0_g1~~TRINITY_DN76271_c0_g1_i1.p1  ORF type:complete len:585 (-),score=86.89 TRINITY_DN76271_c0_g1_i1:225-1940(-)